MTDILKRWNKLSRILGIHKPLLKLKISTVEDMDLFDQVNNGASFSDCRKYRYALWRIWDKSKYAVMFIGLNPSTANETFNDPTVRRVCKFAYDWGFGGVYMMNLFAYVTPYPKEIKKSKEFLNKNNMWLIEIGAKCSKIIFAWGSFKEAKEQGAKIMKTFNGYGYALAINKDGSPRHPLYVKKDIELIKIKS